MLSQKMIELNITMGPKKKRPTCSSKAVAALAFKVAVEWEMPWGFMMF